MATTVTVSSFKFPSSSGRSYNTRENITSVIASAYGSTSLVSLPKVSTSAASLRRRRNLPGASSEGDPILETDLKLLIDSIKCLSSSY